ncbi:ZIP metal cation transporter [Aspergillus fumigatus]|nr:ZIP metal cation transporter [Aspergillus fumigatus]
MVLNFVSPARRTSLALVAGLLLFAVLAAATVDNRDKISVGDLSVPEIEDKLQECPLVEALNEHKRATSPPTASMMARLFAILFPGSPAVNAILATVYISGPPSMRA